MESRGRHSMREWWEEHKDYIEGFLGFGSIFFMVFMMTIFDI